jgi:hypothetical protein
MRSAISRHLVLGGLVAAAISLGVALPAFAASGSSVLTDCNSHGKLTSSYSTAALQAALSEMPAGMKEYTNCYDVVQRGLLASINHGGGGGSDGGGSGGSFLPTPVVVVLVVLGLVGAGFGAVAIRRRRTSQ